MIFFLNPLKEKIKNLPVGLMLVVFIIVCMGLYNLYSATAANVTPTRFYNQLIYISIGVAFMLIIGLFIDLREMERISFPFYIFVCLLLLLVDIFGHTAKGAGRWLSLGPLRLQPSELTKVMIILMIAKSMNQIKGIYEFSIFDLWKQFIIALIPFILVAEQPDLGTASVIVLIAIFQMAVLRINLRSILMLGLFSLSMGVLAWNLLLYDYQKMRVLTFLNPMLDPKGSGYHILQSMIAVGNGGLFGRGFQQGTQASLNFLPERHTDFIFSVWAEEHGFVGCFFLIGVYLVFLTSIFRIATRSKENFGSFVCIGVAAFFSIHFIINISMVIGLFPVVGVPLTLFSYGGTHMITAFCCLGLLISSERKRYGSPF